MNRRYWKYFLDGLRYPEIQHHGALALLAEAEGGELDRLYDSGLMIRDQFFPAKGEKESVLIHGKSRGVPRHFLENDVQYRSRVMNAWAWQHLAGRHWGLHKIFAEYGFPIISLTNLSGEYHWAEFDIEVEIPPGTGLGEEVFDLIFWIVFEYKRASAMLRTLRVLKRARGQIHIQMATAAGEHLTVYPLPPEFPVTRAAARVKLAPLTHETWTVRPLAARQLKTFKKPVTVELEFPISQEDQA